MGLDEVIEMHVGMRGGTQSILVLIP
jgi:hypothetical protein